MGSSAKGVFPWDVRRQAAADTAHLSELRRAIHARPEIGLHTPETQRLVVAELDRLGLARVERGHGCTSVVGEIEGSATGPGTMRTVVLRADMDALPVAERTGLEFASRVDDTMHACGHDAHTAMLLGAARLLVSLQGCFAGTVRLVFQPGEEGCGGARVMIDEGAIDGSDAAFAIHVDPGRPAGAVASRAGTFLAGFDDFEVIFRGAGGHASAPHVARDPIPAIGAFVDGLSHVAAREMDPDDRAVLSVTRVRAGTTRNVIPAAAECAGTIRSLSRNGAQRAREGLQRVAAGVAASRGLTADVQIDEGYPPTVNDEKILAQVAAAAEDLGLEYETMPSPYMGAEDFSYVLERVPGAMVFLGCKSPDTGPLHSDCLLIDEAALALGAALHATVALALLAAG